MKNRLITATMLCLSLSGCLAIERFADTLSDGSLSRAGFADAWARAERQNENPVARHYFNRPGFLPTSYMPTPFNKAVAECITNVFPAIQTAAVVFRLDDSGTAVESVADQNGYVADCISRKAHGISMPPPPTPGFLVCGRYTRLSDSEYALESCGPAHLRHVCKRVGTRVSCGSQRVD